jgi:hypothetical protein
MTSMQRHIDDWWARHPTLRHVVLGLLGVVVVLMTAWTVAPIVDGWPVGQAAYTYAGGWALKLESPTDPPVSEYMYESRERCEESRALEMQRAYHDRRSVPPLACASKYQGWRRLHFALQAMEAARSSE